MSALLTPYTDAELAERLAALRAAEERRLAAQSKKRVGQPLTLLFS